LHRRAGHRLDRAGRGHLLHARLRLPAVRLRLPGMDQRGGPPGTQWHRGGLVLRHVNRRSAYPGLHGRGLPVHHLLLWLPRVPQERTGTAVGWFYVMCTVGLPTLGSLVAVFLIPSFGGGFSGERWAMVASSAIVLAGFLVARIGVREEHGTKRLAPEGETSAQVILAGLRLSLTNHRVMMGFLTRLINTAPQFGMFIILPTVIAETLGWGQSRWLLMTSVVFGGNIAFNAV